MSPAPEALGAGDKEAATFAALAGRVERFAAGLRRLGVRHGEVAAFRLPDWYWPTRIETLPSLPRSELGKVRKHVLRAWLTGTRPLPDTDDAPTTPADRPGDRPAGT